LEPIDVRYSVTRGQVENENGRCKSNQKNGMIGEDKGIREKQHQGFGK